MKTSVPLLAVVLALMFLVRSMKEREYRSVQIHCASDIMPEGVPGTCAAEIDYPPEQPKFRWDLNGECGPRGPLDAPSLEFAGNANSKEGKCELTVSVYDGLTDRLVTVQSKLVNIETPAADEPVNSETAKPTIPVQTPIRSPLPPSAARLTVDEWPKWEDRFRQDAAMVTGTARGVDFAHCKVALYTWSGDGWSLYLSTPLDRIDGRWNSSLKFAPKYAAILASNTVQLEERLRQLPEIKGDIFYVVQSENR
jgi:hypothetical protein